MGRARSAAVGESQRQLRVGEEVRHVLAELFMRGAVHDPVLAGTSVTVSEVRMSRDLRHATVFLTELGGDLSDEVHAALARAAPFLRGEVGRRMRLKYAPELAFVADTSFAEAAHIDALLARERSRHRGREGDDDQT